MSRRAASSRRDARISREVRGGAGKRELLPRTCRDDYIRQTGSNRSEFAYGRPDDERQAEAADHAGDRRTEDGEADRGGLGADSAESSTLDASLLCTWVPKQSATWLAPIASFGPVDPSTESLLWPGCVGFCIVAVRAIGKLLLLRRLVKL